MSENELNEFNRNKRKFKKLRINQIKNEIKRKFQ